MESELYSIARGIGKKYKQVFNVDDIKQGDYLSSASFYIQKLTNIDTKQFSAWNKLKEGQRLRNIIVHSNGYLIEQKEIIFAKGVNVFDSDSHKPQLLLTYEYCKSFISNISLFFPELYEQIKANNAL